MRLTLIAIVYFAIAMAAAGCASTKTESDKDIAKKQWAAARAGVLATLARDQFTAGNFDQCKKTLSEATKLNPDNPALHLLMGRLAIEQGNLELADRELNVVRRLDPRNAEADYYSGVVAQRWQKLQTAYDCYRSAVDKQPTELAYVLAQAEMLVALGRGDEALDLLQAKVVYFEHSAAIRDAVGQLLMQKGKYVQAVEFFRQASNLGTDEVSFREHLAMAQFRAGSYRDAADSLARVLKDPSYATRADLHVALGECRMQVNQPREAREAFEVASGLTPGNAAAWLGMGKAGLQLGDLRRAELSLKRALSLEPGNGEANLLMGYARLKQNQFEEALVSFKKAAALDQSDTVSLCMVGYVLEKLGRGEEALACYARALKLRPGDELASRLMADLQLKP